MKLRAFSLRDTKSETFGAPFFVPTAGIALRVVTELVNDRRTDVGKYPDDFILYDVGEFDTQSAQLSHSQAELVATAKSLLPRHELPVPVGDSTPEA